MQRRASAETQRVRYFKLVTRNMDDGASDTTLRLLQLEYFRRFQLDVQRAYYQTRGLQHRHAADRALLRSTWGMGVVAIANGVAGLVAGVLGAHWASLAGIALVGQAFSSVIANAKATNQDERKAERYERTRHPLDQLYSRLDAVRQALADGNDEVMREFVASVHEQLPLDHRQSLDTLKGAGTAIPSTRRSAP